MALSKNEQIALGDMQLLVCEIMLEHVPDKVITHQYMARMHAIRAQLAGENGQAPTTAPAPTMPQSH